MNPTLSDRIRAAQERRPRYKGKPCRICGGCIRYTINADCVVCSLRRAKKYAAKTRAKIRSLLNGEVQP